MQEALPVANFRKKRKTLPAWPQIPAATVVDRMALVTPTTQLPTNTKLKPVTLANKKWLNKSMPPQQEPVKLPPQQGQQEWTAPKVQPLMPTSGECFEAVHDAAPAVAAPGTLNVVLNTSIFDGLELPAKRVKTDTLCSIAATQAQSQPGLQTSCLSSNENEAKSQTSSAVNSMSGFAAEHLGSSDLLIRQTPALDARLFDSTMDLGVPEDEFGGFKPLSAVCSFGAEQPDTSDLDDETRLLDFAMDLSMFEVSFLETENSSSSGNGVGCGAGNTSGDVMQQQSKRLGNTAHTSVSGALRVFSPDSIQAFIASFQDSALFNGDAHSMLSLGAEGEECICIKRPGAGCRYHTGADCCLTTTICS